MINDIRCKKFSFWLGSAIELFLLEIVVVLYRI